MFESEEIKRLNARCGRIEQMARQRKDHAELHRHCKECGDVIKQTYDTPYYISVQPYQATHVPQVPNTWSLRVCEACLKRIGAEKFKDK